MAASAAAPDTGLQRSKDITSVVFTFGRFQPPTRGHEQVIRAVHAAAGGADAFIFPSAKTNDLEKYRKSKLLKEVVASGKIGFKEVNENPLTIEQKLAVLRLQYRDLAGSVEFINTQEVGVITPFEAVHRLLDMGYTTLTFIAGSDRVPSYRERFGKDKGIQEHLKEAKATLEISDGGIPPRGNKNPMSGTLMRTAAFAGDQAALAAGIQFGAMTEADTKRVMNQIRQGLLMPAVAGGGGHRGRSRRRMTARRRARKQSRCRR